MKNFGERLKRLREEKKMTQQDLADMMGKANKTVISSWELNKNQPSISEIEKLCDYFEVSADYLLRGKELSATSENQSDYVTIAKDELLKMSERLIKYQEKELEELRQKNEQQKNTEVAVGKP